MPRNYRHTWGGVLNLSGIFKIISKSLDLPPQLDGDSVARKDPCSFCKSRTGKRLARTDYWDLVEANLVECACGLIQIDPMPTNEDFSLGCRALFLYEKKSESLAERRRQLRRSFRKGVALGSDLKNRGFKIRQILEVGAGDGYFCKGIQFVFPDTKITCLDIVTEVLDLVRAHHNYDTIVGSPEILSKEKHGTFDLVVARDILEHVQNPALVLDNISSVLNSKGVIHFITPNGFEDIWRAYAYWKLNQQPSELLINHVNYFTPKALRAELEMRGFSALDWRIFNFKGFRKGKGYKISAKVTAYPSTKRSATETIRSNSILPVVQEELSAVIPPVWSHAALKPFVEYYCRYQHDPSPYINADLGIGHEIYGIFQKN